MNSLLIHTIMIITAINVTDAPFSAVPDGKTDCTQAIQAAANSLRITQATDNTGFVLAQSVPTLYFPSGTYVISSPINFNVVCSVKGETAIIQQTGNCQSFKFVGATLVDVDGIKFIGGTNAVYINNPNINASVFNLTNCYFDRTTQAAIFAESTGTGSSQGVLSAELNINKCRFRDCYQMLDEACDMACMNNCWAQMSLAASPVPIDTNYLPFIVVRRGRFSIIETMLVPSDFAYTATSGYIKHYWIYSMGNVFAERTRFSGENGGIPILMFGPAIPDPNNQNGPVISFSHCQLSAGPSYIPTGLSTANPTTAIITLSGMPSLITLENNGFMFMAPMILDPNGSGATAAAIMKIPPQIYIGRNVNYPATVRIPSSLTKYVK